MRTTSMPMTSAAVSSWWIAVHGAAETRSLEPREQEKQHDDDADDVFERPWIEGDVAEALGAADVVPAQRDHRDDLGKSERQQQQIDSLDAERRKAHGDTDHCRRSTPPNA